MRFSGASIVPVRLGAAPVIQNRRTGSGKGGVNCANALITVSLEGKAKTPEIETTGI